MGTYEVKCEICKKVIFEVSCYIYDVFNYHTEAVCIDCYDDKEDKNEKT